MGGSVGFVIRTNKEIQDAGYDEEYRMIRWTNTIGLLFRDLNSRSDLEVFEGYMEPWFKMRKDYEANKDTGNFEHPMTDVYFPTAGCVPVEYGLIVVDFETRKLYSMQGYSDPTYYSIVSSMMSKFNNKDVTTAYLFDSIAARYGETTEDLTKEVQGFIDDGRLYIEVITSEPPDHKAIITPFDIKHIDDIAKLRNELPKDVVCMARLRHPDWEIIEFKAQSSKSCLDFKKALHDDGYVLSTEEEVHWGLHYEECLENEEENEVLAH